MAKEDNKKDDVKKDDRLKALDAAKEIVRIHGGAKPDREAVWERFCDEAGRYFPYAGGDRSDWFFKP